MLVLGILMAIAIPLIGGARQAANNSKCRSNLAQLHTAIISHAKSNDDFILENLAFNNDLTVLIDNGYLDADAKLGDCPGQEGKQKPSDSSYVGGEKMDGSNSLLALTDTDVILADKSTDHHKAGKNAILFDGSFTQTRSEIQQDQEEPERAIFRRLNLPRSFQTKTVLNHHGDVIKLIQDQEALREMFKQNPRFLEKINIDFTIESLIIFQRQENSGDVRVKFNNPFFDPQTGELRCQIVREIPDRGDRSIAYHFLCLILTNQVKSIEFSGNEMNPSTLNLNE